MAREEGAALNAGAEVERVHLRVVDRVERAGIRRDRLQLAVRKVEHEAVHQGKAAGTGVLLELRGQRTLDAQDDARGFRRWILQRPPIQFVVKPGIPWVGASRERRSRADQDREDGADAVG